MIDFNSYTKETIMEMDILDEIFGSDEWEQNKLIQQAEDRAKELGCLTNFKKNVTYYKKELRNERKQELEKVKKEEAEKFAKLELVGMTNFKMDGTTYNNMYCGCWSADDDGIYFYSGADNKISPVASYTPILPVGRMKNIQTGEEKIQLIYKRRGVWNHLPPLPKDIISSASKIVSLSKYGVQVTSESARLLVAFLSEVEHRNDEKIKVITSTSKCGWHGDRFIPYDIGDDLVFDGEDRFKDIYQSIHNEGDYKTWLNYVKKIRAEHRIESKMMLASSFSSVLVSKLGAQPFIVDLWGETEGGKTVSLMLAASVWANPSESRFIGDFKTTSVALETRADMLNNLPVLLDDTSKRDARILSSFESIIYDLCSGKGKSRSNKELGQFREMRWSNCFISNGERPLSEYAGQGGAINRIIEIEGGLNIYNDPQETATVLKDNYGFAGEEFINTLKFYSDEDLHEMYIDFQKKLRTKGKTDKQIHSLAVIMVADKISTDDIFQDGEYIPLEEAKNLLTDYTDISDGYRCYEYIKDIVSMNSFRFNSIDKTESWGTVEGDYVYFYPAAIQKILDERDFNKKSFFAWAKNNEVLKTSKDRLDCLKRVSDDSKPRRMYAIKLSDDFEEIQEENPFLE